MACKIHYTGRQENSHAEKIHYTGRQERSPAVKIFYTGRHENLKIHYTGRPEHSQAVKTHQQEWLEHTSIIIVMKNVVPEAGTKGRNK